jgi:dihydrofolate reductase
VRDVLSRPQLVVMGRVTYQALSAISMQATDEISSRMGDLPKVVVSNTLDEPLAWRNTRIVRGDLAAGVGTLKRESEVPLRTIGSLALVSSMLKLGLVDMLRLTIFPLILGPDGREPFSAGYPRAGLDLADVRTLDSRLVMVEYRILETGRHADHNAGHHGPRGRRHWPGLHGHDALLRHGDTAG